MLPGPEDVPRGSRALCPQVHVLSNVRVAPGRRQENGRCTEDRTVACTILVYLPPLLARDVECLVLDEISCREMISPSEKHNGNYNSRFL